MHVCGQRAESTTGAAFDDAFVERLHPADVVETGVRVRALDRTNIGTVVSIDDTERSALVHFVSSEGMEAEVRLAVDQLEPLTVPRTDWVEEPEAVRELAATTDDPYTGALAGYLVDVDDARARSHLRATATSCSNPGHSAHPVSGAASNLDRLDVSDNVISM